MRNFMFAKFFSMTFGSSFFSMKVIDKKIVENQVSLRKTNINIKKISKNF